MTSATLAVEGGFDFVARELGCDVARELVVQTPFDFERQALLVVPRGGPDPKRRDEHERWVADRMVEIAEASRGRMLGLFTSRRGIRKAAEAFDRVVGASTWKRVLIQGEAPRGQLVEEFKREIGSVLLGLDSFWEGVDVPGEALSVVVIDRLPFATPDDPVLDAVDAQLPRGAFEEWSLPRAITAIRQGAGRLIRSKKDRGVVVILDERIITKGYGRRFLRSLPPAPLSRDLQDVGAFLRGKIGS
jgi:ATP-dependent DNA helicase DinG